MEIISKIFNKLGGVLNYIIAILAFLTFFYNKKKKEHENDQTIQSLQNEVEIIGSVNNSDDVDVCVSLGGLRNKCEASLSHTSNTDHK